jgi:hypothetical protein
LTISRASWGEVVVYEELFEDDEVALIVIHRENAPRNHL